MHVQKISLKLHRLYLLVLTEGAFYMQIWCCFNKKGFKFMNILKYYVWNVSLQHSVIQLQYLQRKQIFEFSDVFKLFQIIWNRLKKSSLLLLCCFFRNETVVYETIWSINNILFIVWNYLYKLFIDQYTIIFIESNILCV